MSRLRTTAVTVALLLTATLTSCATAAHNTPPPPVITYTDPYVIDGDTIDAYDPGGNETRIRILGIDAAEDSKYASECGGADATAALTQLLTDQPALTLITDDTQPERDKYGRVLGYLELADGTDIGLRMIELGLAEELTIGHPHARQHDYQDVQQAAAAAPVGVWANC
ncbi:endonuclease YncB(thermonuclease family) [Antricoccus suffuscus]|uniref:Endonuclease YncB(Thermonuclease family) n=1 Tax=Antricoccus suffuscus TaxID=1629062 RepID=A0A2T0ZEK5_9ACTN|nr:thermonuclease family protein [Antricoccus suffuscus]PRZ34792.1 endonuclease YncB(thermonuclease family) [Antricoccus suffuscus]